MPPKPAAQTPYQQLEELISEHGISEIVKRTSIHDDLIKALNEAITIMESMGGYLDETEAKVFKGLIQRKVMSALTRASEDK